MPINTNKEEKEEDDGDGGGGFSYIFHFITHNCIPTQIHRAIQYAAIHMCPAQDNNHSRAMTKKKRKKQHYRYD